MNIKCPQCATGYNIPEEVITGKPRKMRCSRCKHVFTLHRRSEEAPAGYEEFTGRQNLPTEFAFLREAPAAEKPPLAKPIPAAPAAPAPPAPPAPDEREGLYRRLMEQDDDACETIPLDPPMVSAGPAATSGDRAADVETPPAAAEPAPESVAENARPSSAGAGDIYDSSRSAWEMEAPLELDGFAIHDEPAIATHGQTAGKVMAFGLLLLVFFFLFVAYRNGWSLSFTDLPEQIAFAFSGAPYEPIPAAARDIELTVSERHLVQSDHNASYLVVSGTVFNSAPATRREIMLRGRLVDSRGDIRGEVRAPCGRVLDEEVIRATAPDAMDGHYRRDGAYHDCRLRADGASVFQLIFTDVPLDYDSGFTVDVRAVAAAIGD